MSRHSSRGDQWARTRARILERDAHTCYACGGEADTVDHIVAKARGGGDEDTNLAAMCRPCNGAKAAQPLVRKTWTNARWLG